MENKELIVKGLEKAFLKLIEFKKYKNSPLVTMKDGKVVEISPDKIKPVHYKY